MVKSKDRSLVADCPPLINEVVLFKPLFERLLLIPNITQIVTTSQYERSPQDAMLLLYRIDLTRDSLPQPSCLSK